MYKLRDSSLRLFTGDEEQMFNSYFDEQEKTDRWVTVYTNELRVYPMPDILTVKTGGLFPLTTENGMIIKGFEPDTDDIDIKSSVETTRTMCVVPENDKLRAYPLRYTAFGHMQDRSGVTGSSISSVKDRKRASEMPADIRCKCINEGLKLYNDKTLVLIRDGKITAMLSGDDEDYAVMPVARLRRITEAELKCSYSNAEFKSCRHTHDITEVMWKVNDTGLSQRIAGVLSQTGELIGDISVELRLTTSDVGKCAARLTPVFSTDGRILPAGKPVSIEHKGGDKAIAAFTDAAHVVMAKYNEGIENFERMMKVKIYHPAECLKNTYAALKLTGYAAAGAECQERIRAEKSVCTAYDIYFYLNEALCMAEETAKKAGKEVSLFNSIRAQETAAEVMFMDLKQYDYEG